MTIYLILGIGIVSAIASLLTFNLYLIIFSSNIAFALIFLYKLWDLFEAVILKKTHTVQLIHGFELEEERLTATRAVQNGFSATAAASLRTQPNKELTKESLERIIANSNFPFRMVLQVERLDESKILDALKTKRRMKELELSKASGNNMSSSKLIERAITLLEDEINSISSGSLPIKTETYLITTAVSESKFLATERATAQIKSLAGQFSSVTGASFEKIAGTELARILAIDSTCGEL